MKKPYTILGIVVLINTLLIPQVSVIAQSLSDLSPQKTENYASKLNPEGLKSAQLGNCFDVYNLGSVVVNITLNKDEYDSGDVLMLKGNINNLNNYPLSNLKVQAKVIKVEQLENKNKTLKIVDEFIVAENINLNSLEGKNIDSIYTLPIKSAKGDYRIELSVVQNNKIVFSDYASENGPEFVIRGENQENISIDQKGIMFNDKLYDNTSLNNFFNSNGQPITIKVPIQNNTSNNQNIDISYEIYEWDDNLQNKAQVEKIFNQQVELEGGSNSTVSYTIENREEAVYYIKIIVKSLGEYQRTYWDNIVNIRVVNQNISKPKITFATLNTAPYNLEKDLQLITCINNSNNVDINGIVENIVKDENGRIIVKSQYEGRITEQIDGIYTLLPTNTSYNSLTVISVLKDSSGNIIDSMELKYDCQILDSSKCKNSIQNTDIWVLFITLLSLTGLIFIGLRLYMAKRIKI